MDHEFSSCPGGFRFSPLCQERIVYAGQLEVYEQASEVLGCLGGIRASDSTVHRVCNHHGQAIEEELYKDRSREEDDGEAPGDDPLYAMLDGSMISTDQEWREVKLGRVFEPGPGPSEYAACLGSHEQFSPRMEVLIDGQLRAGQQLVFVTDGARWMRDWMARAYPDAVQVLDFYHACEHLGEFARVAIGEVRKNPGRWYDRRKEELRNGMVDRVIEHVGKLPLKEARAREARDKLLVYLKGNRYRMKYDEYLDRGWLIGSGAVEAAHRTVVQRRMKLSGQRWSIQGANNMLNLRVAYMSEREDLIKKQLARAA